MSGAGRAVLAAAVLPFAVALGTRAEAADDWAAARGEAASLLAESIRIDTSNPPGAELPAARQLASFLRTAGLTTEVLEGAPGRGNLIARLPATAPDGSGAILLLAHLDVVPAEPAQWSVPPFAGEIRDGAVWGRGALDDKGQAVVFATALALLAREGDPRRRDLVLCASADEEVSGAPGVDFLIEHHWDALGPPAVVWNEGGGSAVLERLGGVVVNGIATTEKRALWLTLTTDGESGHGSQPQPGSANDRLVEALARIEAWQTPLRLTDTVEEQLGRLGARLGFPWNAAFYAMRFPFGLWLAQGFLTEDRLTNAMVRDTIALTGLRSGLKHNVIPGHAEAMLDVRILPDTDASTFLRELDRVIDDPDVHVMLPETGLPGPSPQSPSDDELFLAIGTEMERELPGSVTLPVQTTGGTDSLPFRARGIPAYGYLPALVSSELNETLHGDDERFPLEELERAVRVTTRVLRRLVTPAW